MRPVRFEDLIDELMRLTPISLSGRQLAVCMMKTEILSENRSSLASLVLTAMLVDPVENPSSLESKQMDWWLRSGGFLLLL